MENKVTTGYVPTSKVSNLTLAYVRNELREGRLPGDPLSHLSVTSQHQGCFKALKFMLSEYDRLWFQYRQMNEKKIKEYSVAYGNGAAKTPNEVKKVAV